MTGTVLAFVWALGALITALVFVRIADDPDLRAPTVRERWAIAFILLWLSGLWFLTWPAVLVGQSMARGGRE